MEVTVTGEPAEFHAPKSVFDRLESAQQPQQNVRAGLFGTAIDSDSSSNGPSFSVTLGGASESFGRQAKLVQPFHTGANNSNNHQHASSSIVQPFATKTAHQPSGQPQGRGRGLKEGPNFLFRDDTDGQQQQHSTRGLRQPFAQQQQSNRGSGDNRPRSSGNPRPNGGNNRERGSQQKRDGGNRSTKPAAASATDLDADLDAYFAK